MHTPAERESISAEAVDWFLKLRQSPKRADQEAFSEWLTRSPLHIEEYLAVSTAWGALDVPDEGPLASATLIAAARESWDGDNIVPLRHRSAGQPRRSRSVRSIPMRAWLALAASIMLGVGVWVGLVTLRPGGEFETAVGEQRSVTLRDGSVVFLNTDSKVSVHWLTHERHIDLVRGEARFRVAKSVGQPFVVVTARAAVQVLGTVFNVRADSQSTQVAVLEGEVVVVAAAPTTSLPQRPLAATQAGRETSMTPANASPTIHLSAGQRAAVTSRGIEPNMGPSLESVTAWTERRLVFRDELLGTVVSEFNRYRTQPLLIDDPQLAALKISGAFDLNDTESLIAYLKAFETVRVERTADGAEHLSR